jgi:hypothetical protein
MLLSMDGYSHADFQRLAHENAKLKSREAKEKSQAVEYAEKAIVGVSAAALGFGIGVLNAQNGATAEAPYLLSGTVPIDTVAAGLGAIAILATPTHGPSEKLMPLSLGAGAAALGIWGQRTGYAWQQARATAAGTAVATPAATPTSGAYVGFSGGMAPRFQANGQPGGHYGGFRNAYVDQYGG